MKIYLAASESSIVANYGWRPEEHSNLFMSYFYHQKVTKSLDIVNALQPKRSGLITIDSGAHSFFGFAGISVVHGDNNKKDEMPDHIEYFRKYVEWLKENYNKFSYFVELDLQALFGSKLIWEWREILKSEGLLDKCIMVHHSCDDKAHFDKLIKFTRSGYIGLEGKQSGVFKLDYLRILKIAYSEGIKTHGFALTSQGVVEKYPFFSVDSSSWIAGVRYGVLYKFNNGKMHQINSNEKSFVKHTMDTGLVSEARSAEASCAKLKNNEIAFNHFQDHTTKLWKHRGIEYGTRFDR